MRYKFSVFLFSYFSSVSLFACLLSFVVNIDKYHPMMSRQVPPPPPP